MKDNQDIVLFGTGIGVILLLNFFSPYIWLARGGVLLTLVFLGVLLPNSLYLWPSFLSIPADLTLISGAPDSGDLLVWGCFVGSTYFARKYFPTIRNENRSFESSSSQSSNERETSQESSGEFQFDSMGNDRLSKQDPESLLKDLLIENLRWAKHHFNFDNLVYFTVQDETAKPRYIINQVGEIRKDSRIGKDVGQGVGWILRQNKELKLEGNQVDWRSLQYHANPVQLELIWMKPILIDQELEGILVLEWSNEPEFNRDSIDDFYSKVQKMITLGNAISSYDRESRRLQLIEKIIDVDPIEPGNSSQLIGRIKEIINQFIPSDHVEFLSQNPNTGNGKVLDKREIFHQKCWEYIEEEGCIIRSSSGESTRVSEKKLNRFLPPDVNSFLAGPVRQEDELLGVFVLDDEEKNYFKQEDKELLETLLDRLSHLLVVRKIYESSKMQSSSSKRWIQGLSEMVQSLKGKRFTNELVQHFKNSLNVNVAAIYWKQEERYELLDHSGENAINERIVGDSSFIGRIRNAIGQNLINIPDLNKFRELSLATGTKKGKIIPLGEDFEGFLLLAGSENRMDKIDWSIVDLSVPLLNFLIEAMRNENRKVNRKDTAESPERKNP